MLLVYIIIITYLTAMMMSLAIATQGNNNIRSHCYDWKYLYQLNPKPINYPLLNSSLVYILSVIVYRIRSSCHLSTSHDSFLYAFYERLRFGHSDTRTVHGCI